MAIEDALKKSTVYSIEGRLLNIKELEGWLHGEESSTDATKDLEYLVNNNPYLQALCHFYASPAYRRVQFMRFVSK